MQLGKPEGRTTSRPFSYARRRRSRAVVSLFLCAAIAAGAADNPVTILRLRVVEGDAAVYATGARTVRPLTVQVTDETGRPVAGAAVSFILPGDGASGMFNGNMRSDLVTTGADGRASAGPVQWNRTPGAVTVRVTAAKSSVRAGSIVSQYLSDSPTAGSLAAGPGRGRWFSMGLIVAGAGAGALAVALMRSPGAVSAGSTPAPAATISIGTPSITVGRP